MSKPVTEKIKSDVKLIQTSVQAATDATYDKALKNLQSWVVSITERKAPEDAKELEAVVRAVDALYSFEKKLKKDKE